MMEKRSDVKFYCCHNPFRDAVPNKLVDHLMKWGNRVMWLKGRPEQYFKKVDACITDVGSSFFFNAIRAKKPVLCLLHRKRVPIKLGTFGLFGRSIQLFISDNGMAYRLGQFLDSPMTDYIPTKYIESEQKPNDPLVWEER
jgi:hypothetical protein